MADRSDRPLDLVVFGATSFVGQILCRHLVERHGTDGELRWAIAGRDADKLAAVAADSGAAVERIVADARDRAALDDLVGRTRVVVSTVGPYALYGSELVAAAAAAGTDYCDLTGETQWMRRMIDAHQDDAAASGARIVHACGFDSIPSDLGVHHHQRVAVERFGDACTTISMRVAGMKGGASGGTIASMMNVVEEVRREPALRKVLANPYALAPEGMRDGVRQPEVTVPTRDDPAGEWVAPFVMAAVNTRVVQRSHALAGRPWGDEFRYDEAMVMGSGPLGAVKGGGLVVGLGAFMGLAALGPTRNLLNRYVLPKAGEGPSPEAQRTGYFDLRFFGETEDGRRLVTQVTGDRDPGYGSTAKMLGETAVALVGLDPDALDGGFWTPSTALGDDLVERLEHHAGVRFRVID